MRGTLVTQAGGAANAALARNPILFTQPLARQKYMAILLECSARGRNRDFIWMRESRSTYQARQFRVVFPDDRQRGLVGKQHAVEINWLADRAPLAESFQSAFA